MGNLKFPGGTQRKVWGLAHGPQGCVGQGPWGCVAGPWGDWGGWGGGFLDRQFGNPKSGERVPQVGKCKSDSSKTQI